MNVLEKGKEALEKVGVRTKKNDKKDTTKKDTGKKGNTRRTGRPRTKKYITYWKQGDGNQADELINVPVEKGSTVLDFKESLGFQAGDDFVIAKTEETLDNDMALDGLEEGTKVYLTPAANFGV